MVVLIVDDQVSVIDGMMFGINWDGIHVNKVYKAYSAFEAKQIIRENHVDIMLCDIEMPYENGLSLFEWTKKEKKDIECIFLTAHADFFYAKTAIKLGGFDYIVQPARYEDIEAAINRAIKKHREKKNEQKYVSYGKLLCKKKEVLIDNIVRQWILEETKDSKELLEELDNIDVSLRENQLVYCCMVQMISCDAGEGEWNNSLLRFSFSNIIEELFLYQGQSILVSQVTKGNFFLLIYPKQDHYLEVERVEELLDNFLNLCKQYFKWKAACYMDDKVEIENIAVKYRELLASADDNVTKTEGVFRNQLTNKNYVIDDFPEMTIWEKLLLDGNSITVCKQIDAYFDKMEKLHVLNAEFLKYFYYKYMQMLTRVADKKSIPLDTVLYEEKQRQEVFNAYRDVENLRKMIYDTSDNLTLLMDNPEVKKKQVDLIVQYICNNIDKDIRRNEIADAVFLNPNYLSRLFKNEIGIPLKEFINEKKMELARDLLRTTSLSISMVALKVGFSNFSYFSQVYKKHMGITPTEERGE